MNKVLIVIDAQEDFTRGALRNEEAINALPVIHDVVCFANEYFDNPIIYTQDSHEDDYLETQEGKNLPVPHCITLSSGWDLCEEVKCDPKKHDNLIVMKESFGYDDWTERRFRWLKDVDEIWMCGFCTDICVSANFQILKALFPEVPITIIEDACAGVTPELHDAALKVMKSCQARVLTWEELKNEA